MKKSLKLFLILVIALVITDRVLFILINVVENEVYQGDSVGRPNQFMKIKDSVDLIVFGSSRAIHHIDVNQLSRSSYNIGTDGKRLGFATALIKTLNKKNQIILIHIDHNRVFDQKFDGQDALSLINEAQDNSELGIFFENNFKKEYMLSKIFKCYSYNGKLLGILKNYLLQTTREDTLGYKPLIPNESQIAIFKKMLDKQKYFMNVNIDKPLIVSDTFDRFVDMIVEQSKKNKSRLFFFTSPSLNKVDNEVRNTAQDYFKQKKVIYFDHINFLDGTNQLFWQDYTHMTRIGAETYTQKLKKELSTVLP